MFALAHLEGQVGDLILGEGINDGFKPVSVEFDLFIFVDVVRRNEKFRSHRGLEEAFSLLYSHVYNFERDLWDLVVWRSEKRVIEKELVHGHAHVPKRIFLLLVALLIIHVQQSDVLCFLCVARCIHFGLC